MIREDSGATDRVAPADVRGVVNLNGRWLPRRRARN